jgi:hypothetical protein
MAALMALEAEILRSQRILAMQTETVVLLRLAFIASRSRPF